MRIFLSRILQRFGLRPDTGAWGERQAEGLLRREGFRIVGRRVRFGGRDELDLVARKDGVLVFVEVKTRANEDFGRPAEAIDRGKRHSLSRAAVRYMTRLRRKPELFRFDVVEVVGRRGDGKAEIRHIENAFNLESSYRLPW
jgi:putative endonuclease